MYPDLHPCAHRGCTRHALHGSRTCGAHAGDAEPPSPPAWPASDDEQYVCAGAFDLVLAQRDSLHRFLHLRAGYLPGDLAAELRALRALALIAAGLAPAGTAEDVASARAEIEAFVNTIANYVLAEADAEVHGAPPPPPPSLDPADFPQLEAGMRLRGLTVAG